MRNYFRIKAYHPNSNTSAILDCYGKFEQIWQFSSYLVAKGIKIIKVCDDTKFEDGNIQKVNPDTEHIFLRACDTGQPIITENTVEVNGKKYILV